MLKIFSFTHYYMLTTVEMEDVGRKQGKQLFSLKCVSTNEACHFCMLHRNCARKPCLLN